MPANGSLDFDIRLLRDTANCNIKPIFNLVPHVTNNFVISSCTGLSDQCPEFV